MRVLPICLVCLTSISVGCGGDDDDDDDVVAIDASASDSDADNNAIDGGSSADADPTAPDGGTGGILCGDMTCDEATQVCCVDTGPSCVAGDSCEGVSFGCDGPEDCPEDGEACCGGGEGTQCQSTDACAATVCHTADDCPDPPGPTTNECCPIADLEVGICRPNCSP